MVFWPLSDARMGLGTTFIIDLWFTGIILAGLAASLAWRRTPVPAVAGLAVLCGYVAFQGVLQQRAVEWGEAYAKASGLGQAEVTAQPRPVSPFNWMVIVRKGDEARYSFINLVRREPLRLAPDADTIARLDAAYLPRAQAQWVHATRFGASDAERTVAREAWSQPQFAFYRWFSEEPVLLRVDTGNPSTCAWFQDLRFFTPGRDNWPFRYGMCREGNGRWELFRLFGDSMRVPVR
jgi:inner membrane protein